MPSQPDESSPRQQLLSVSAVSTDSDSGHVSDNNAQRLEAWADDDGEYSTDVTGGYTAAAPPAAFVDLYEPLRKWLERRGQPVNLAEGIGRAFENAGGFTADDWVSL